MGRRPGSVWPRWHQDEATIRAMDRGVLPQIRSLVLAGRIAPLDAEALHRHVRWTRFARLFAASVD